jgi:putative endonuclease
MTAQRRQLGLSGEDLAAAWYVERGFEVVVRNWRSRTGELDLIVRKGRLCVICEVKTRTSSAFGEPFEAVTFMKQRRLRRLAAEWLATGAAGGPVDVRFDVASIKAGVVEVVEAAF